MAVKMNIRKYKSKYHKYIFIFHYDAQAVEICKQIKEQVGWINFSYFTDDKVKGWAFSDLKNVLPVILNHFSVEIDDEMLKDATEGNFERNQGVAVKDLRLDLSIPTLKPLFPFQVQVVDFTDKVGGKALLALDMGTGKTICAIGYACYKKYGRVLVICPASVKENWKREIKRFSGVKARILTEEDPGGWEIINYDQLAKYYPYFQKQEYDLIIVDEEHYIKNRKSIRSKVALKILKNTKDALFLTGTPIMNRPLEIYNVFNYITPTNYWEWVQRYCGALQTRFGWDLNGASNLDELKEKMWWMIRRTKEEVLEQLPEKTINVLTTEMKDWKEYNKVLDDFRQWLIDKDLSLGALYAEALTKVNYLKQVVVKNKNIKEIIDDFLENGKKIVVFSQYLKVVDDLYKQYEAISVKFTGLVKTTERQGIIDKFQNDKDIRIFFSTIGAGGVGINLTEADTVVFTDLSWSVATHNQAESRVHRHGIKNAVNVYYLITPKTIEEKIWSMLRRKEKLINQIMEGSDKVRKVHIRSLLKNL